MRFLNNIRITIKLPVVTVLLVSAAVILFGIFVNRFQETAVIDDASDRLVTVLDANVSIIERQIAATQQDLKRAANERTIMRAVARFKQSWAALNDNAETELRRLYVDNNPNPPGERQNLDKAADDSLYSTTHAEFHAYFRDRLNDFGYHDILILDEAGNVLYSVQKNDDFGSNVLEGPLGDSSLSRAFRETMESEVGQQVFEDFEVFAPGGDAPVAFLAQQVLLFGKPIGVIAYELSSDGLDAITQSGQGLGETGEIVLVGPDMLLRTNRSGSTSEAILMESFDGPGVQAALAGQSGAELTENRFGVPVVRAFRPLEFTGARWAAVAEMSQSEALAGLGRLHQMLFWGCLAAIATASVAAIAFSASLARPLRRVTGAIGRISGGDFGVEIIDADRHDEIGHIAEKLDGFRRKLRDAEEERVNSTFRGAAFSASTACILMLDRSKKVRHANRAVRALFVEKQAEFKRGNDAFDPEAIRGNLIESILPADTVERISACFERPESLPAKLNLALGNLRLTLDLAEVRTDAGEAIGFVIEMQDVTASFLNQAVLDSIDGYQVRAEFSLDHKVLDANTAFCAVVGKPRDEIMGRNQDDFLRFAGGDDDLQRLRTGEAVFGRFFLSGPDGRESIVDGSANPVKDSDGAMLRYILIATDVTEAQAAIAAADEERKRRAAQQATVVENLRGGLGKLAEGDLTAQIATTFSEEYEQLRSDFNRAVDQLLNAMRTVAENAEQIQGGASEISSAADDMSARTERQAATLEETAAALDQLTTSVRTAAEGAAEANRIVETARGNAENSGEVVRQAVDAMSELEASSKQISKITEVIDDIAYQTNLLALNAGVEAARAGEAGRGFAVVASEVRALAQRSSEAAREINELISSSGRQVKRGVDLVGQAGEALKSIVVGVVEIARHVSEIAESSREQSGGLAEINEAVGQLDQVTQQNAAMFEETTAAGHSLKREAEMLTTSMARFRTGTEKPAEQSSKPPAELTAAIGKTQRDVPAKVSTGVEKPGSDDTHTSTPPGNRALPNTAASAPRPAGRRTVAAVAVQEPEVDFDDADGWSHF
ncbi:methyl-accepting chemotaxis protein [Pseudoruegeria sp. HB172150]|uniref:methyl-accepting chemotaxis protein n=1 Tax=Pseudoruegeria sp. HB172150 TaxID=2721164 RepID=UPI0015527D7C|nr:methyl-accepting chemotaxis protein [Pseudoruegeria sp. HB172150]